MHLSDLQIKDIVSIRDGRKLGKIIDVEINHEDGKIIRLIVEQKKKLKSLLTSDSDTSVLFSQIVKIGEDVILIDL